MSGNNRAIRWPALQNSSSFLPSHLRASSLSLDDRSIPAPFDRIQFLAYPSGSSTRLNSSPR